MVYSNFVVGWVYMLNFEYFQTIEFYSEFIISEIQNPKFFEISAEELGSLKHERFNFLNHKAPGKVENDIRLLILSNQTSNLYNEKYFKTIIYKLTVVKS